MITKGDRPLTFEWELNGRPIQMEQTSQIAIRKLSEKTSVLNIDYITATHRGTYECIVSNKAGSSFYESELSVHGIFKEYSFSHDLLFLFFLFD
jgi:Down syndrome cell adhesion molecule-like protein 1